MILHPGPLNLARSPAATGLRRAVSTGGATDGTPSILRGIRSRTWNDATMLGEARRFQANNPNYIPGPGEPNFFGRRPPPTPEELAARSPPAPHSSNDVRGIGDCVLHRASD